LELIGIGRARGDTDLPPDTSSTLPRMPHTALILGYPMPIPRESLESLTGHSTPSLF